MDDEHARRAATLKKRDGRLDRAPGLVHVRLRLQQRELGVLDADLGEPAAELPLERALVPARQLVDDHPADVVPVRRMLAAGVAEACDEQVERRGRVAPTEEAQGYSASD